jgi:diamine N-acetyltransferase
MIESLEVLGASPSDAVTIAALATQVFLDTYATSGVRPDLAREAFHEYSEQAFSERLNDPKRNFLCAMQSGALVGFAELLIPAVSPVPGITGAQLVRLYVQPRAQRGGIGKVLVQDSERTAAAFGAQAIWLTAWEGNANALAFYPKMGYADVGATTYSFEDRTYGNRVFAKRLAAT